MSVRVALGLSLAMISAVCACNISGSDKAGGRERTTTVLTMANGNFRPQELQLFADQVASLSAGSMRITFRNEWGRRFWSTAWPCDAWSLPSPLDAQTNRTQGATSDERRLRAAGSPAATVLRRCP